MSDLLFEIGTEEIPAGYLQPALEALKNNFIKKAKELELTFGNINVQGTPRRFVLAVENLLEKQEDKLEELLGPSKAAGFDGDGNATKAAQGFARSKGASVEDLKVVDTDKGQYLMLKREVLGKDTIDLLPDILSTLIGDLTFPKSMNWGANTNSFARPIQWIVALFDGNVVPCSYNDITSSNITRGHRFLSNVEVEINTSDLTSFEEELDKHSVIVSFEKRKALVVDEITAAVASQSSLTNAKVAVDEGLVKIVTNLVEKPIGVCGSFDEKFLQLPPEVLITSMREHQKYFPVVDDNEALLPAFVAVNNTKVKDIDITRKGHQRVLRARLEDAFFFFEQDKETKLEDRYEKLKGIIFQAKLGTMQEKCDRIIKLTRLIAEMVECKDIEKCVRAATLCKTDLLTDMVGEFPSLQGVMGGAYALNDGEGEDVAVAIKEHYMPVRAGAAIPSSDFARIIGLADRLDTLSGCFGIGQVPTGTADPFGLRRISLAILQIIRESGYRVSLQELVGKALALYGDKVEGGGETVQKVMEFVKLRFENDMSANKIDPQATTAVTSIMFDDVNDVVNRVNAFLAIKKEESFPVLAASFKRIRNIIKENRTTEIDAALFEDDAENVLAEAYAKAKKDMDTKLAELNYVAALESMLLLKEPVDNFFDKVMVMSENENVKQNRLNMLTAIGELVLKIGDISKMQES